MPLPVGGSATTELLAAVVDVVTLLVGVLWLRTALSLGFGLTREIVKPRCASGFTGCVCSLLGVALLVGVLWIGTAPALVLGL